MCSFCCSRPRLKRCTILGLCLSLSCIGVQWFWGTLSVYVYSSVVARKGSSDAVHAPWVMFLMVMAMSVSGYLSAILTALFGKRLAMVCALLVFEAGFFGAYLSVQSSFVPTIIAIGFVAPLGTEMAFTTATQYALDWSDNRDAALVCLVQAAYPGGAIAVNQIIKYYINPDNLNPDTSIGKSNYFSQAEIVDRVPSLFLLLALISSATFVVGVSLITDTSDRKRLCCAIIDEPEYSSEAGAASPVDDAGQVHTTDHNDRSANGRKESEDSSNRDDGPDFSPREALRQPNFHYGWILVIIGLMSYSVSANYYKEYGLTCIDDDHFITNISVPYLLAVALSRVGWGMAVDRYGWRTTQFSNLACSSLLSLWFYFSPLVSRWCYAVVTVAFAATSNAVVPFTTIFAVKAFGKKHYLVNQANLMLVGAVFSLILPFILRNVLLGLGWFYIYLFCSACSVLGLILIITKLPDI